MNQKALTIHSTIELAHYCDYLKNGTLNSAAKMVCFDELFLIDIHRKVQKASDIIEVCLLYNGSK